MTNLNIFDIVVGRACKLSLCWSFMLDRIFYFTLDWFLPFIAFLNKSSTQRTSQKKLNPCPNPYLPQNGSKYTSRRHSTCLHIRRRKLGRSGRVHLFLPKTLSPSNNIHSETVGYVAEYDRAIKNKHHT